MSMVEAVRPTTIRFPNFKPWFKTNVRPKMGQFASGLRSSKRQEKGKEANFEATNAVTSHRPDAERYLAKYAEIFREKGFVPDNFLVHDSPSNFFIDEDGDIANEFYTEQLEGKQRRLAKVVNNLRPKGRVRYDIPRLSPDIPVVILQIVEKKL